jgi:hypothetical protein
MQPQKYGKILTLELSIRKETPLYTVGSILAGNKKQN